MAEKHEIVWDAERRIARSSVDVRRRMAADGDILSRKGACLGAAEGLLTDALRLIACDFVPEGVEFLRRAGGLARTAYENGETYGYSSREFANYVALRIVYVSEWLLGETYSVARQTMIDNLLLVLRSSADALCFGLGHVLLHFAEEGEWTAIAEFGAPRVATGEFWGVAATRLKALAAATSDGRRAFIEWFSRATDPSRHGEPFDPELTWPDVVLLARVKARVLGSTAVPIDVVRMISRRSDRFVGN